MTITIATIPEKHHQRGWPIAMVLVGSIIVGMVEISSGSALEPLVSEPY